MKKIKLNTKGFEVKLWQEFLKTQNLYNDEIVHINNAHLSTFNEATKKATKIFQDKHDLDADGIVGDMTYGVAERLGFEDVFAPDFPKRPNFSSLQSLAQREAIFGKFGKYKPDPNSNNGEIIITDDWEDKNIVFIDIPQLKGINKVTKIRLHKIVAEKVAKLFVDWEKANLLDRVRTWDGGFYPRFVRNNPKVLSNHAYGTAFDINEETNPYKTPAAAINTTGCIRELVPIANANGFFWGGHFNKNIDGMHFELTVLNAQNATRERSIDDVDVEINLC